MKRHSLESGRANRPLSANRSQPSLLTVHQAADRRNVSERDFPPVRRPTSKSRPDGAPQSTIEALVYELRENGLEQLGNPTCLRRLGDVSTTQLRSIIGRLINLRSRYPNITDELLLTLGELL
jgi:hypothetical protein